ncbi:MAG TPA: hypothetical protein VEO54_15280 [Thermoanaerobaculia bacterium]|nr:hypothetical protein [Thermoanaerobaculia bacterium]
MKQLTVDNWLAVDPIIASGIFVRIQSAGGTVAELTADDWTARLLDIHISPAVPDSVRDQVEIARGAMIYGSLFYPLFTLGLEQLFRVSEAAARAKAAQLGIPNDRTYYEVLADLRARNMLTDSDHDAWSHIRRFRNVTTHAQDAMILAPGAAIGMFATVAAAINQLFTDS